jgi:hypothetical protein
VINICCFLVEICQKVDDKNLTETFSGRNGVSLNRFLLPEAGRGHGAARLRHSGRDGHHVPRRRLAVTDSDEVVQAAPVVVGLGALRSAAAPDAHVMHLVHPVSAKSRNK